LTALARDVKDAIVARMAAGDQYLTVPRMGMFIPSGKNVAERFARRLGAFNTAAVGVTNLGRVQMPTKFGPLRLERMNVAVGVSAVGHLSLAVSTFANRLSLNFIFIEPHLQPERVARMADAVVKTLQG
jgi:hypothetical protein